MAAVGVVMALTAFFFMNLVGGIIGMVAIILTRIGTKAQNIDGKNTTEPFHKTKVLYFII